MPILKEYKPSITKSKEWKSRKDGPRHMIFKIGQGYYTGKWKDNEKSGFGYYYSQKSKYEGHWMRDKRHGYGIFSRKRKDGSFDLDYEGGWKNGKRDGNGFRFYKDGSVYEGGFSEGNRQGKGRLWYSDGSFYEGQWYKDKRHGIGLFVYSNGNRYEGEWKFGLKNGKGIFYHLCTGQEQEGQWRNDHCVESEMRDISYRQAAWAPTPYSIPKLRLISAAS